MLQNSTETLERLEHAFDDIKKKLFDRLHEAVRQQIFPLQPVKSASLERVSSKQLPEGRNNATSQLSKPLLTTAESLDPDVEAIELHTTLPVPMSYDRK